MPGEKELDLKKVARTDLSGGGILNDQQADKFLHFVIDNSVMKNSARMIIMNEPVREIDKVGVGARVALPKTEGTAPSTSDYVVPSSSKITLTTKPIIVPRNITWETLEDNIEREGFEDTMLEMISIQLANDLEELFITGDTTNVSDAYLALMDGWLKLAQTGGHAVDIDNASSLTKEVFSAVKKALPVKYKRTIRDLRFFVNPDDEQDYRDSLTERETTYGDDTITGERVLTVFGIPVVPVPMMPQGTIMLTHYQNLIVGMHRKGIHLEKDRDIYAGVNQYAIHARVACQIENTDCVAYATNIAPLETVGLKPMQVAVVSSADAPVNVSAVVANTSDEPIPTVVANTSDNPVPTQEVVGG